ncbi:hypothetical protein PsorP6_010577 [Peronosclerospora sorghi]|uniref:Uncharacterized protein n=1 Tax=Peronosclerospora sorghi TaxID=230839 RepID=A0ACC0VWN8_9STRA|nr:hypothetical protein PsorP6_010577 [Peronosclerospora sorghi]
MWMTGYDLELLNNEFSVHKATRRTHVLRRIADKNREIFQGMNLYMGKAGKKTDENYCIQRRKHV